jgi:hypothetical protein
MLTQCSNIKIYDDVSGSGRDIRVTPLFFQNQDDPWEPNEIFDLAETAKLTAGKWGIWTEPVELGKIIIDDKKDWHFEGESALSENELKEIARFVLGGE